MIFDRELKSFLRYSFMFAVALFLLVSPSYAQNAAAIATYLTIDNNNVIDGYIVATDKDNFIITDEAYQKNMIGIVNKKAAIEIKLGNNPDSYPVSTSGQSYVLVTLSNGMIAKGDYITSSPLEGIGMKATVPGPIIGVALEDANDKDETIVTKVRVSIQKDYNVEPLFGFSNIGDNPFLSKNTDVIKYFFGGLVLILSLIFSYLYFGKLSLKGVEALGRNPLASKKIQSGIILNVFMALSVCLIGLITAMYIIRS